MSSPASINSLLSGRNPSGSNLFDPSYGAGAATGSSSGQNPMLPPMNLPPGAGATNPFDPTSVVPTFGANQGGYSSNLGMGLVPGGTTKVPSQGGAGMAGSGVGSMSGMSTKELQQMLAELSKTFGAGTGSSIMNFLMGGAGFNQQAVSNMLASLQPGVERGTESLMQQFSTSGNRFGSGAQIGLGDYLSQVNLNEGQIAAQLYEKSITDYIDVLMGAAGTSQKRIAAQPSTLENILSPISNIAAPAAGAASAGGVGGTLGSILDIVAAL